MKRSSGGFSSIHSKGSIKYNSNLKINKGYNRYNQEGAKLFAVFVYLTVTHSLFRNKTCATRVSSRKCFVLSNDARYMYKLAMYLKFLDFRWC